MIKTRRAQGKHGEDVIYLGSLESEWMKTLLCGCFRDFTITMSATPNSIDLGGVESMDIELGSF